jgi:hypothetical protein
MRRDSRKEWTKWRKLVSAQARSEQSVAVYCGERGLKDWQFYAWKKRLREAEAAKFVEVKLASAGPDKKAGAPAIEVRLGNGRSLVVGAEFDVDHLQALLAVLETRA